MAVISRTCQKAMGHMNSLLLAISILVGMWGGAGMILFGHQIKEFNTPFSAMSRTLQIVIVADDSLLSDMNHIAPGVAIAWHWSLLVVMYVVVLNIILAVLVRSFEGAASELHGHSHASVFAQAKLAYWHYYFQASKHIHKLRSPVVKHNDHSV
eukprot:TRINITY_DN25156_c0_g2_i2.p1 TRINITY_DN25156_c0_g2~~TRINITY_DN25156_c0_g2_i2.p1  ORF type:complete len:154 (+),score=11.99 TRINITY_DN25156_c0_g2_i2:261-722(+)